MRLYSDEFNINMIQMCCVTTDSNVLCYYCFKCVVITDSNGCISVTTDSNGCVSITTAINVYPY